MNINPCNHQAQVAAIFEGLKRIQSGKNDKNFVEKLKHVDGAVLKIALDKFFSEMVQKQKIKEPAKFVDRLASVIPFSKLQQVTNSGHEPHDAQNALKKAKEMFEEAKVYLKYIQEDPSPGLKVRLASILDGIIAVIETLVNSFGIRDFFKSAESDIHADFKTQKIMTLLSLFSMITTMILPLIGIGMGSIIIGGTLLAIAGLSILWSFIKPAPTFLPGNAENWTQQVKKSGNIAEGRKEVLDEIANILKMNRHALLVGPSRVGKGLTAKAFTQAIERGDYPELKGKIVFRINTTDLLDQKASFLGGGNNILYKISEAMGRHRDNIILVLDEIHMACKNNEKIADQLKTFLDVGGEFPHVIGITTSEDYEKYVKDNGAFSLRFDHVDIKNMDKSETINVLAGALLRSPLKPLIKPGALEDIYQKASRDKAAPQPETSLRLCKRCIHITGRPQQSSKQKEINKKSNEIISLRSQAAANRGRKKELDNQIETLEKELRNLQKEFPKEQKDLDRLYETRNLMARVTQDIYLTALKIGNISRKKLNADDERQLKRLWLLQEFLDPSIESYIETRSNALGVKAIIDKNLIECS